MLNHVRFYAKHKHTRSSLRLFDTLGHIWLTAARNKCNKAQMLADAAQSYGARCGDAERCSLGEASITAASPTAKQMLNAVFAFTFFHKSKLLFGFLLVSETGKNVGLS